MLFRNEAAELAIPIILSILNWPCFVVVVVDDHVCCSWRFVGLIDGLIVWTAILLEGFRAGVGGGDVTYEPRKKKQIKSVLRV